MEIRVAREDETPQIVNLLKASLGESLMPKSVELWSWKHVENPFGRSPVLVATEGESIIGIRAFMRWTWQMDGKIIKGVRAVDTATHPDYQGKGIFKKLTLSLLDECRQDGIQMVFNTPNKDSLPGYLKMGWETAGKLNIRLRIRRPLDMTVGLLKKSDRNSVRSDDSVRKVLASPGVSTLLNENEKNFTGYFTPHTVQSLKWRYETVPVTKYFAAAVDDGNIRGFFMFRLKASKLGLEFRILDIFVDSLNVVPSLKDLILRKADEHSADFITVSGCSPYRKILGKLSFSLNIGPRVTIRSVSIPDLQELDHFKNFSSWHPSIGDLELF